MKLRKKLRRRDLPTLTSGPNMLSVNFRKSGFDMKTLSIIGRDFHTEENVVGYYTSGDRMKYWGKLGAFWGGFWGVILFGFLCVFFWLPGVGTVLVAGPLVVWIVGTLEVAAVMGGLSALGAANVHHRHPEQQCRGI